MTALRALAVLLIVAGALALGYGSFSYTEDTHHAKLGPLEMAVKEKKTVNVPAWAGVAAVVAGGVLLFVSTGKR